MKKTQVLIVDDHRVVRRGLAMAFRVFNDLELVGEAANGAEAVELCGQLSPDVVLMDLIMPDMDGVSASRLIRCVYPAIQVVVMTASKEDTMIVDALKAGAASYVLKSASIDQIAAAIRAVAHHNEIISNRKCQEPDHAKNSYR